jgi:hypothetical protein
MERKRYAETWRFAIEDITNIPFKVAAEELKSNVHKNCFAQDRLNVYASNVEKGIPNDFTLGAPPFLPLPSCTFTPCT